MRMCVYCGETDTDYCSMAGSHSFFTPEHFDYSAEYLDDPGTRWFERETEQWKDRS